MLLRVFALLLYKKTNTDNRKQDKKQHILQETVVHLVHFSACVCVFYCACENGTTRQDHRNQRTDRITTTTEAGAV